MDIWVSLASGLMALNVVDVLTTHLALARQGLAAEKNPLARWAFGRVGFWPCVALKLTIAGLGAWWMWKQSASSLLARVLLTVVVAIYCWVVGDNVWKLARRGEPLHCPLPTGEYR